jgi:hypothetical protein
VLGSGRARYARSRPKTFVRRSVDPLDDNAPRSSRATSLKLAATGRLGRSGALAAICGEVRFKVNAAIIAPRAALLQGEPNRNGGIDHG